MTNAPVNQNRELRDGYRAGVESVEIDPTAVLKHEHGLITRCWPSRCARGEETGKGRTGGTQEADRGSCGGVGLNVSRAPA